jgi:hypothetical protein
MADLSSKIDIQSRSTGEKPYVEKPTLVEFAAVNALSNNANMTVLYFEMAKLSAVDMTF